MKDDVFVQCQVCGKLYRAKSEDVSISDEDLYIKIFCPKCRDDTDHLWCGENETEIYYYYNANLDSRYY